MPPTRTRQLDDAPSEASSTATKEKPSGLGSGSGPVISKGKRFASNLNATSLPNGTSSSSSSKAPVVTTAPAPTATMDPTDPNLPRIQWTTFSTPFLHTYRHVYHLGTPSSHTHPHADLIFASSPTGLRSPASVAARRKAWAKKVEENRRRRKSSDDNGKQPTPVSKERERSSDRLKAALASNSNSVLSSSTTTVRADSHPSGAAGLATSGGGGGGGGFEKQHPHALAMAVRRHFNSQQVSEGDVIAKFAYVVRHGSGPDGDDKGFRLRFRP